METKNKLTRFKKFVMASAMASFATTATVQAEEFTLHFSDPVGDASPILDVSGMDFSFDPATGSYIARFFSAPATPFSFDRFPPRIFLNLLNLDRKEAGAGFELLSVIQDSRTVSLSPAYIDFFGVSSILTSWQPGDRVAPGQRMAHLGGLLPPPHNSLNTTPLWGDAIGLPAYIDEMGIDQFAIVQVPEPSSLALGGVGLAAFFAYRRFRTSIRPQ